MRSVQVASLSLGHVNVLIKLIIRWTRVQRVNNVIIMTGLMRIKLDYSYSQPVGRLTSFEDYVIFIFISKCVTEITQIKMQNFNDEVRLMLSDFLSSSRCVQRQQVNVGMFVSCHQQRNVKHLITWCETCQSDQELCNHRFIFIWWWWC